MGVSIALSAGVIAAKQYYALALLDPLNVSIALSAGVIAATPSRNPCGH